MRRIVAHYIYWKKLLPLHYIELDDNDLVMGVYALNEELAGTEFWDGIVYPTVDPPEKINSLSDLESSGITDNIQIGNRVIINQIPL